MVVIRGLNKKDDTLLGFFWKYCKYKELVYLSGFMGNDLECSTNLST